ncbi:hypothetical protein [Candidatus Stoquefichus massiliensis]|uniref:hypothetical protein n=1 Tax=Candidatus Stoquefichus massiliensis TaxID=1470350 RepID=UPI000488E786|nr:hypothetical protein [Candidatus Stoquefichus massiliensis]
MLCSLIGAFLLIYVVAITFMNILEYPLAHYMIIIPKYLIPLKKGYIIAFCLQILAIVCILIEGHIIQSPIPYLFIHIICIIYAFILTVITIYNCQSHTEEKKQFMAPLLFLITLCFWLTIYNTKL